MAYKIAVASSDGKQVDLHFGGASFFYIYDVSGDGTFSEAGRRDCSPAVDAPGWAGGTCGGGGCCSGKGCGNGGPSGRVELLSDVRAVVAAKIGFNVTKQLEKKAISSFDVTCSVREALEKITKYFYSVDNHVSLARR